MTLTKDIASKLAVAFVAVAMTFALVAPATQAAEMEDMSVEEMQTLINELLAQLGGSSSTSGSCDYTFTAPMGSGASGVEVMNLQQFLNMDAETRVAASGVGSPGMESQYYGSLTAAAVSKFQTKYRSEVLTPLGLVNPTGYFGNSSITKANAMCAGSTGSGSDSGSGSGSGSSSNGDLEGGAGSLDDVDYISKLSNEEVGEDEEDVEVAGLEIEADDNSDIELRAVNLNFSEGTAGSDFDKYASEVSVWFEGEEVARMDADEFEDDDNFDKTVTLDRGAIIRGGDTGELVVAVSGINNLDSLDSGDTWTIEFESVRFADAQGGIITDSDTGDINDGSGRTFSFESFATAADVELKVSKGDDDINDKQTIAVDTSDDTDNVELLSFEIEIEGDSDINIDDLSVDLVSTGGGVGEIVNTLEILVDGDVIGSETVSSTTVTTRTITFDSLDWDIEAGETVEVIVRADANNVSGGFTEGATLSADVNPDDAAWDVEDENGDDLSSTDKTGTASSDDHEFRSSGVQIAFVSEEADDEDTTSDAAGGELGMYTIEVDVTAFEGDIYVPTGATTATSSFTATKGIAYAIENEDGEQVELNGAGLASTTAAVSSTADKSGSYYVVEEGDTETFTLQVTLTPLADGYFRAQLYGVNYNVDAAAAADTLQTATPESDFESDYVNLDA